MQLSPSGKKIKTSSEINAMQKKTNLHIQQHFLIKWCQKNNSQLPTRNRLNFTSASQDEKMTWLHILSLYMSKNTVVTQQLKKWSHSKHAKRSEKMLSIKVKPSNSFQLKFSTCLKANYIPVAMICCTRRVTVCLLGDVAKNHALVVTHLKILGRPNPQVRGPSGWVDLELCLPVCSNPAWMTWHESEDKWTCLKLSQH